LILVEHLTLRGGFIWPIRKQFLDLANADILSQANQQYIDRYSSDFKSSQIFVYMDSIIN